MAVPGSQAEQFLISEGIVARTSLRRRRVLGCIGCQFLGSDVEDVERFVTVPKIVECSGIAKNVVWACLRTLNEAKLTDSVVQKQPLSGRPPVVYTRTNVNDSNRFYELLPVPESCGFDDEGYSVQGEMSGHLIEKPASLEEGMT